MPGTKNQSVRIRLSQKCSAIPTVRKAANGGMKMAMMIRRMSKAAPVMIVSL